MPDILGACRHPLGSTLECALEHITVIACICIHTTAPDNRCAYTNTGTGPKYKDTSRYNCVCSTCYCFIVNTLHPPQWLKKVSFEKTWSVAKYSYSFRANRLCIRNHFGANGSFVWCGFVFAPVRLLEVDVFRSLLPTSLIDHLSLYQVLHLPTQRTTPMRTPCSHASLGDHHMWVIAKFVFINCTSSKTWPFFWSHHARPSPARRATSNYMKKCWDASCLRIVLPRRQ